MKIIITDRRRRVAPAHLFALAAGVSALHFALPAAAADTLETWEQGAWDVEAYLGWDGLGRGRAERLLTSEVLAGYGLADGLSVFACSSAASAEDFGSHDVGLCAGAFGRLVDTAFIDVDWELDVSAGGAGLRRLEVLPLLEFTVDPPEGLFGPGLYTRLGLPVSNAAKTLSLAPLALRSARAPLLGIPAGMAPPALRGLDGLGMVNAGVQATVGARWVLLPGHEVLAELDLGRALLSERPALPVDIGGLVLGYNLGVGGGVELINQVVIDIPQAGERPAAGVSTGFILSVPPAG